MNRSEILAPREAEIMALWDAGRSIEQIAAALSITRGHASTVVNRYAECEEGRLWRKSAAIGSAQLLHAITGLRAAA